MIEDVLGKFRVEVVAARMNESEDAVEMVNVYSMDGGI